MEANDTGFPAFIEKKKTKIIGYLSTPPFFFLMRIMCVCCLFFFPSIERGEKKEPFSFYALVSNSIHDSGVYPTIPRPDNFLFRLSSFFLSNNKRNQAQTWGGDSFLFVSAL